MPTFASSQEWLEQSSLLLQARPTTTRITTRYTIKPVTLRPKKLAALQAAGVDPQTKAPRGSLEIKTYCPASGVTLKYRTTKAAEVSRLIHSLGRLGKGMAGLPDEEEGARMEVDATEESRPVAAEATTEGVKTSATGGGGPSAPPSQPPQQQQGGGGGKKKKKGKK